MKISTPNLGITGLFLPYVYAGSDRGIRRWFKHAHTETVEDNEYMKRMLYLTLPTGLSDLSLLS